MIVSNLLYFYLYNYTKIIYTNFLKLNYYNCWDNAPIKSFFSHLKSELIYLIDSKYPEEIIKLLNYYIYFYNNERIQIKNGMSPVEYRKHAA